MPTEKQVEAAQAAYMNHEGNTMESMCAAIEAAERAAWSDDMDAAPEDGTPFLAFYPKMWIYADPELARGMGVTRWQPDEHGGGWALLDGDSISDPPTHWRLLPPPPVDAREDTR